MAPLIIIKISLAVLFYLTNKERKVQRDLAMCPR